MGVQKPHVFRTSIGYRWNAIIKRTGIRPRNPYHTRHTYACWLLSLPGLTLLYRVIAGT